MKYLYFNNFLEKVKFSKKKLAVLCIGTDRVIYDSLGPLVGTLLSEDESFKKIKVFGTLGNCIDAKNVVEVYESIKNEYAVIAIDAAIVEKNSDAIGKILFNATGMQPAASRNKNLPLVGDFYIQGCVTDKLYDTKLSTVYNLAKEIVQVLKCIEQNI